MLAVLVPLLQCAGSGAPANCGCRAENASGFAAASPDDLAAAAFSMRRASCRGQFEQVVDVARRPIAGASLDPWTSRRPGVPTRSRRPCFPACRACGRWRPVRACSSRVNASASSSTDSKRIGFIEQPGVGQHRAGAGDDRLTLVEVGGLAVGPRDLRCVTCAASGCGQRTGLVVEPRQIHLADPAPRCGRRWTGVGSATSLSSAAVHAAISSSRSRRLGRRV